MNAKIDQQQHLLGLTLIEGIGHILTKRLVAYCGNAQEVFKQKASSLIKIPGIGIAAAKKILQSKEALLTAEKEINYCTKYDIKLHSFLDNCYPKRLKNCEDGPSILFEKGNANLNPERIVNIIGTRQPSAYGMAFTEQLIHELSEYNVTVVSGMAFGIDVVAHKTSLKNKLPTVGVFAHGLSMVYPSVHANVAKQIENNGSLVTEHIHLACPDKENFPKRNRIVAGMCDATIVIETDIKGGSMITAKLANDYNREVFALPGRPGDEHARGCNFLIKTNRAALFENTNDIIQAMGWQKNFTSKPKQTSLFEDLAFDELAVATVLKNKGKCMIDIISYETNMAMNEVSVTLLNMEFKGYIRALPGKYYELI